jgi:mannosyltransferase
MTTVLTPDSHSLVLEPEPSMADPKTAQPRLSRRHRLGFFTLSLLVVLGTLLRLHMLGAKSLWLDEAFSVLVARMAWPAFLRSAWWGEANMVPYYLFLRPWIRMGDSEFWLRSLSAVFGVLTIVAVYKLGKDFLSPRAGLVAAALLSIHSYHIRYSQELRSYSLVALLVVLSTYAFLAMLEKPDRKVFQGLYVLFSALAIYSQVLTVLVLCSQWLALTPSRVKQFGILRLSAIASAMGVLAAPIAWVMFLQNKGQLHWVPRPTPARVLDLLLDMTGAGTLGSPHPVQNILLLALYAGTWIFAFGSLFFLRQDSAGTKKADAMAHFATRALALGFAFPIVAMIAISFEKPMLVQRYLLMCVPAAVLLAAQGLVTLEPRVARGRAVSSATLVVMLALACSVVRDYYACFATYGHDWRAVTNYLLSRQEPGDAAIFYTFSGHRVFDYYLVRAKESTDLQAEPTVLFPMALDRGSIEKHTAPYRRVWFVVHQTIPTAETDHETELIRSTLQAHFRLIEQKDFPGTGATPNETGEIHVALYAGGISSPNSREKSAPIR